MRNKWLTRWPDAPVVALLIILAWANGFLYAFLVPPWDLIDEEQHVDYIYRVATEQRAPVVGQDYLSPPIAGAVFDSNRWATYHWPRQKSAQPQDWGLEGYSYEGSHPPLFYLMLAPFYRWIPGNVLAKLYGLRFLLALFSPVILLSLIAVWKQVMCAARLDGFAVVFIASWMLSADRAMVAIRVDNDWLAWLIGILLTGTLVTALRAPQPGKALWWSGFLTAIGLLTKLTLSFYIPVVLLIVCLVRSRYLAMRRWALDAIVVGGMIAMSTVGLASAYWVLYGDVTGQRPVDQLLASTGYVPPPIDVRTLASAAMSFITSEWITWWHGLDAFTGMAIMVRAFDLANALIIAGAVAGVFLLMRQSNKLASSNDRWVWIVLLVLLISNVAGTFQLVISGRHPFNQARFLTPVDAPLLLLIGAGWRRIVSPPWDTRILVGWAALLAALDVLYVVFYLHQYFYA